MTAYCANVQYFDAHRRKTAAFPKSVFPKIMINLAAIVTDPDLAQPYTIQRTTGAFASGGYAASAPTPIAVVGVITVAKEKDLDQAPEADRVQGAMLFYATQPINLTSATGLSDTILWRGDNYRVAKVWVYADFGYYKAFGVRMTGA